MGCRELDITSCYRLTPTPGISNTTIPGSAGTKKTANSRFKPVVSVSVSIYRYYSPQIGKWLSRDPIFEIGSIASNQSNIIQNDKDILLSILPKFFSIAEISKIKSKIFYRQETENIYAFIFNAPTILIDQLGLDAIAVFDNDAKIPGGITVGHPAVLVGNDTNGWTYFSFSGGDSYGDNPWKGSDNLDVKFFKTLADAKKDPSLKKYDEFARWKTTEKQDKAALREGTTWQNKWYILTGVNCEDLCGAILKAAGKKWADKWKPKKSWEANKKNADSSGKW